MKNTISFNTKFGWISATEINQKITQIQFIKAKNTGVFSKNLKNLQRYFLAYFQGNIKTLKAPIKIIAAITATDITLPQSLCSCVILIVFYYPS